ncbi:glycine betaine ABC transporter substrate-binding protein [Pseudomonas sichuanensis]|uniref:glycine betaine ABC transporter substrate-binding protein n=1 Tax=Pseudomonas sichuanensis TaxID=2213015 RepID=UPI002449D730|nr:glycine betaine ABC transporter substrate-binding protein [Pseudomonas sichuanensis]MDH0731190.1 glycine betaine ABC transporter substrate-binding protein [Pseudomonas sichuanensis]MDH1583382.1 glycine betaine ABC transporter substrate-binding protein [Pseudomonas sichuanensis]MDH1593535.1 glycine betaine ABC transporter substrate-binding protein [Pseudomonas sichuanensis]MDH1598572.1 glycine betaine ABC transporter substrate-binding protein [Pseudomonas sichuanensis]
MKKTIAMLLGAALLYAGFAQATEKPLIHVGARMFTEQTVLAEITAQYLRANGFEVRVTTGLGSNIARQAQETGQLDLMWEYTGVSLVSYNHVDERMPNADATYARVKALDAKKGLVWLTPSKFSNTYALGLPRQVAEAYPQINTISDLNQVLHDEQQRLHLVALDTEFANRPDGLVGLRELYGLPLDRRNIRQMDGGLVYTAMRNDQVFAGLVYTTDGRLNAFNLKLLEDDKHYFPDYTAAPVLRQAVLDAHPQLATLLKPLAEQLDDETMRQLNAKVDVEHQSPTVVAAAFLQAHPLSEVKP